MADKTEKDLTAERLGGPVEFDPVYQPPVYDQPKTGPGRWCVLYAQGGTVQLGYLWQGDNGSLGFQPSSDAGVGRVPEFYQAFSRARAANSSARDVFQDWAGRAGLGLSAGPVTEGDLDTLPE